MRLDDIARCAEALEGVRRSEQHGLAEWRYHGRLVARQLDAQQVVIRAEFGYRDGLVSQNPETFTVPRQFLRHMMVVANLDDGDSAAIEDAIEAAWQLQRSSE